MEIEELRQLSSYKTHKLCFMHIHVEKKDCKKTAAAAHIKYSTMATNIDLVALLSGPHIGA